MLHPLSAISTALTENSAVGEAQGTSVGLEGELTTVLVVRWKKQIQKAGEREGQGGRVG